VKIGLIGAGAWGTCLAHHLASCGHEVTLWVRQPSLLLVLESTRRHPKLSGVALDPGLRFSGDLQEVASGKEMLVESVTSKGLRGLLTKLGSLDCPFVITSKGIEQGTGFLLPDLAVDVLGEKARAWIGCLSGPSHAEEVIHQLPTSVVAASFDEAIRWQISKVFTTPTFRVYPNSDIKGVAFGGAMKNVIAIACGISDGLGYGDNARAALMTRGLHEIRKLSVVTGCLPETLNGLSGMGDLCVTCMSQHSRNYRFGRLVAEGNGVDEAQNAIEMVVEGAYTCVAALELAEKEDIPVPITEGIYRILYKGFNPQASVVTLMERAIKEEHL
jgi:glycerol-3-phosphate dehydrogenase (NAD(P)+)